MKKEKVENESLTGLRIMLAVTILLSVITVMIIALTTVVMIKEEQQFNELASIYENSFKKETTTHIKVFKSEDL